MFLGVVNPSTGSSIGLGLVKLLGGDFISEPGRTRVFFGGVEALAVQVPNDALIWARAPSGVLVDPKGRPIDSSTVDVRVDLMNEALDAVIDSATLPASYTYTRTMKPTFDEVTRQVLLALRSLVGRVFIDMDVDYTEDGIAVAKSQLPAVLLEGPNLIRDEFRSGRAVTTFAQGSDVPRFVPPWARIISYEMSILDTQRSRALQTSGHLIRWFDSGPQLTIFGRQVDVHESLPNQLRAVTVSGQDYLNGRVVAYHSGLRLEGVEIPEEDWDIAAEVEDPEVALDNA